LYGIYSILKRTERTQYQPTGGPCNNAVIMAVYIEKRELKCACIGGEVAAAATAIHSSLPRSSCEG
jgi:hypothetical protein